MGFGISILAIDLVRCLAPAPRRTFPAAAITILLSDRVAGPRAGADGRSLAEAANAGGLAEVNEAAPEKTGGGCCRTGLVRERPGSRSRLPAGARASRGMNFAGCFVSGVDYSVTPRVFEDGGLGGFAG